VRGVSGRMGPNGGLGGAENGGEEGAKNELASPSLSSFAAREWARLGVWVDTESAPVNGEETLEMTWVGARGVCVRDVKDCSFFWSVFSKVRWKMGEQAYLIYCARHTPFVCARDHSPPHTCTWSGAMNLVSPFVEVEAS
jgi:hypothetical protein